MPDDLAQLLGSANPTSTEADWRAAVDAVLKGASFGTLRTATLDGITIEPLYSAARGALAVAPSRGATPWVVSQRVDHPHVRTANDLLLADLEGGASGIDLVLTDSPNARSFGLAVAHPAELAELLAGVMLDLVAIRIDGGSDSLRVGKMIAEIAGSQGLSAEKLDLTLLHDPIGLAASLGGSERPLNAHVIDIAVESAGIPGRVVSADGRIWHEAGASRVETLAAMLATAVTYWRALEAAGLPVDQAAAKIGFTLAVDPNQFSSMAEIRALRLLWARATSLAGIPPALARIHAETSFRMMSRLDANANMIRTTIAAFAAGVGGADSVTVLPFSAANGLPDAFARRLARNTQLILLEESNLARVTDPAAGSGRIEAETRQLADAAWELFRQIEAGGGIVTALRSGTFQARIAATSGTRMKDIARRKHLLTGASDYPLLAEPPVAVLDVPPRATPDMTLVETFPGLDRHRLSEPFERLRDTAVTAAEPVFVANLGTSADYNARSAWLKNLLEVGGIATVGVQGCATVDDLVAAFKSSGAKAACLVSSDRVYATTAIAAVRALKAAGAAPIFFAGRPGEGFQSDKLEAAGVDICLYAGQDVVAALSEVQVRLVGA